MAGYLLYFRQVTLVLLATLASFHCASVRAPGNAVFVGSTPGHRFVRDIFRLGNDSIDFIKWTLHLEDAPMGNFRLELHYGLAKPNTSGFYSGGKKHVIVGTYTMNPVRATESLSVFQFTSGQADTFSMMRYGERLMHLLEADGSLATGNGGWSYTLTRSGTPHQAGYLYSMPGAGYMQTDTARLSRFEGRSPCREITKTYDIKVPSECFKLKWRVDLLRDAATGVPALYRLFYTLHRQSVVEGRWTLRQDLRGARIIQLHDAIGHKSLYLLVADRNVLFFLDSNNNLLPGDRDFSYTLNRIF
ncbi:MAG TPA: hypothetical protein VFZ78_08050 [Flavisolibacter sp.]